MKYLSWLLPAITRQIILTALAVALSAFTVESLYAADKDGVKDGGGGNVILFPGQTQAILLDRLMLHPELATAALQPVEPAVNPAEPQQAEFEPLHANDRLAIEQANQKLESWLTTMTAPEQGPSRELVRLIKYALQHTPYIRASYRFKTQSQYYLPEHLKSLNPEIKTAILFVYGYGALISTPVWDGLDLSTRVGLIIHESVRQMQVQFQVSFDDIQNEQIQLITAALVDSNPTQVRKFDDWMSPSLYRYCLYKDTLARVRGGAATDRPRLNKYIETESLNLSGAIVQPEANAFFLTDDVLKISTAKMLRKAIQDKIQNF